MRDPEQWRYILRVALHRFVGPDCTENVWWNGAERPSDEMGQGIEDCSIGFFLILTGRCKLSGVAQPHRGDFLRSLLRQWAICSATALSDVAAS
jgi:hypothetical protein